MKQIYILAEKNTYEYAFKKHFWSKNKTIATIWIAHHPIAIYAENFEEAHNKYLLHNSYKIADIVETSHAEAWDIVSTGQCKLKKIEVIQIKMSYSDEWLRANMPAYDYKEWWNNHD